MDRALGELQFRWGEILLESQPHFSSGHISACAYPFFCQIVLFIVHTTQNSHEHRYSGTTQAILIVFTLCPKLINHSSRIPYVFQLLFSISSISIPENGNLGVVFLAIKRDSHYFKKLLVLIHVSYSYHIGF